MGNGKDGRNGIAALTVAAFMAAFLVSCESSVSRVASVTGPRGAPYTGELVVACGREHWIAPVTEESRETFSVSNGIARIRVPVERRVSFILKRPAGGSTSLAKAEVRDGGVFRLYGTARSDGTPRASGHVLMLTKPVPGRAPGGGPAD
jgi:hypothetical protein